MMYQNMTTQELKAEVDNSAFQANELRQKANGEDNLRKKLNMKAESFRLAIMVDDMNALIRKREGF
ncbi:MAG: hypothetical protein GY757_19040 [bacterium]|nr:hypothetical protein [bacterium]